MFTCFGCNLLFLSEKKRNTKLINSNHEKDKRKYKTTLFMILYKSDTKKNLKSYTYYSTNYILRLSINNLNLSLNIDSMIELS